MKDIDDLLHTIAVPITDVASDVRRGERALRRRHRWQAGAAAAGVAAIGVAGWVSQGASGTPGSTGPVAGQPGAPSAKVSSSPPAPASRTCGPRCTRDHAGKPPRTVREARRQMRQLMDSASTKKALVTYHDVLAEHLDPSGTELHLAQNEQAGTGSLGTKLDWRGGGMLEITVGRTWAAAGGFYDLYGAKMAPTTFQGHPARVSTAGDDLVVSVQHDDGTVVSLIASTSFGNNGTSTASLGLTQQQLLEAAADPRLVLPPGV
jgi:hypothetical protein